jgi:small GTP-binding protein
MANFIIEIKLCIVGDSEVGKTCMSYQYCNGSFPKNTSPTIGASFLQRRLIVDNCDVYLQIWDTAG